MRLGKRERLAKRARLQLAGEREQRILAVTGPAIKTGFDRWPVGKPRNVWGFSRKAGAPAIRPYWKATKLVPHEGIRSPSTWQEANKILEA